MRAQLFALVFLAGGCAGRPPPSPSRVLIRVVDEAKQPVAAAEITTGSAVLSVTDPTGRAEVSVNGREGETFSIEVRCPNGYRSKNDSIVSVRKFDPGLPPAEYVSTCTRARHSLSVDIHADGGPNLPVFYLGKEIARTDASGVTRVELEGDVGERIELTLSTASPELAKVHPQNPFASFVIEEHDAGKTFDVKLTRDKPPKKKAAAKPTIKPF